ncbi:MAG: PilZ domain-containing protein [Moraxellaceae bacterium]
MSAPSVHTEQRRVPRQRLAQFLPVHDLASGEEIGRLADVSTSGLMLISQEPLVCEQEYLLEILPPGEAPLQVTAVCVWCRPNPSNAAHHGAGLRYSKASGDTLARLAELMRERRTK